MVVFIKVGHSMFLNHSGCEFFCLYCHTWFDSLHSSFLPSPHSSPFWDNTSSFLLICIQRTFHFSPSSKCFQRLDTHCPLTSFLPSASMPAYINLSWPSTLLGILIPAEQIFHFLPRHISKILFYWLFCSNQVIIPIPSKFMLQGYFKDVWHQLRACESEK